MARLKYVKNCELDLWDYPLILAGFPRFVPASEVGLVSQVGVPLLDANLGFRFTGFALIPEPSRQPVPDPLHGCPQRIFDHVVDQADAQGILGMQFLRRCEHLQSFGFPDQARQALRATPACDQT